MKKLFRFIAADVRMTKRTELLLRYLMIALLVALAACMLIIWVPLTIYGGVGIKEPSEFIRIMETSIFGAAICFGLWMAVFYARRVRRSN